MEKLLAAYLVKRIWESNAIDCTFNEHIVKQFDLIKNENEEWKQKRWGFLLLFLGEELRF